LSYHGKTQITTISFSNLLKLYMSLDDYSRPRLQERGGEVGGEGGKEARGSV